MAAEPPPLDELDLNAEAPGEQEEEEEEGTKQQKKEEEEEEDLSPFGDPEPPQAEEQEEEEQEEEEEVQSKLVEEPPPPLQSIPLLEQEEGSAPTLEPRAADEHDEPVVKQKPSALAARSSKPLDLFDEDEKEQKIGEDEHLHYEALDEEERDMFEMTITVAEPEKMGDGMSSYMTYAVSTKTTMATFHSPENCVRRRFSDFLGLHQRLEEKYGPKGRVIPPAPQKNFMGTTKVKFTKSEEGGAPFIERRRAALERYLNRVAKHPILRKDEDFRNFLENPAELPKSKETAAMSGAGLMRLVKNVGESIAKITGKKTESDTWFEEQQQSYDILDSHLKKLHQALETMIACRKDLCASTSSFVKSIATVGNVEENNSVAHALSRLSEVQDRVETLHQEQTNKDLYIFAETVKDYIALLASIRNSFAMRVKAHSIWQSAQNTLVKKKDSKAKLQAGGKPEKLAQVEQEIKEWEIKVEEGRKNFEDCSKTLKTEVKRFEVERSEEFKVQFIAYLETLMHMQQELIRLWEGYLPDAQAIAV